MSKQHIWPNWMSRDPSLVTHSLDSNAVNHQILSTPLKLLGYNKEQNQVVVGVDFPQVIARKGAVGSRKLRLVCNKCNNGWMSKVEELSKPVITALMQSQLLPLSRQDQVKLASWLTQMVIVFEFTNLPSKTVSYQQRKFFLDEKLPPPGWAIWLGRFQGNEWKQRIRHTSFGFAILSRDKPLLEKPKPNFQTTVLVVGSLFAYIIGTGVEEAFEWADNYGNDGLIKIWPVVHDSVDLSSLSVLTDADAMNISESLSSETLSESIRTAMNANEKAPDI